MEMKYSIGAQRQQRTHSSMIGAVENICTWVLPSTPQGSCKMCRRILSRAEFGSSCTATASSMRMFACEFADCITPLRQAAYSCWF